jgi:NADP-dependent aldehyde dehydrogenase
LRERAEGLAEGLHGSVTLGVGQFCTNPGLVLGLKDPSFERFLDKLKELTVRSAPGTMLHEGIRQGYEAGTQRLRGTQAVKLAAQAAAPADRGRTEAPAMVFVTEARSFLENPELSEEVFGPSTLVVSSTLKSEIEAIARRLEGHLTATVHASAADLQEYRALISILETKVGRLVFNGFPTGVEVCPSMQHGGPYPATTDARTTSVGTAAISRFARPICYQSWPQAALPAELRDKNERKIWRLVDGELTKEDVEG